MTKTTLIERMTKGGAAKTWINEVEAKDREIERLEQTKDQYLDIIDLLACEKEQLAEELEEIKSRKPSYGKVVQDLTILECENAALKRALRDVYKGPSAQAVDFTKSPELCAWVCDTIDMVADVLTEQESEA